MALIVQKFGGSSVKDAERINNVADIVTSTYKEGNDVVVVVSAQGDTTDDLIAKAAEINEKPSKREMDMLLSSGEQISAALLSSDYGNARIKRVNAQRIEQELDKRRIVVVTGFQGVNRYGDMTTLGRGGSDTSAVAIAAAMHADLCQIFTDVDGVYTADPRKIPGAIKLSSISYDEMLELATLGAQVLHNRSVEMAKKYNIELEVLSSLTRRKGTIVKEESNVEKMLISGVAKDDNIARISIIGVPDKPGLAFKIFSKLASKGINVDIILQSIGRNGTKDVHCGRRHGDPSRRGRGDVRGAVLPQREHPDDFHQRNQDFRAYQQGRRRPRRGGHPREILRKPISGFPAPAPVARI